MNRPEEAQERGSLLAVLAFGNFIVSMGAFIVIGMVTPIADGLGVSKASAGIVLTTYCFAYALLAPIGAALTGQLSRRTVLVGALLLFLLGSLASALSLSLFMLAASRIVVALGAVLFQPLAAGVAVAISRPEYQGKALAKVFGGATLATVVGVPLGAWMAYRFGWAAPFWAAALLSAIGAIVLFFTIPSDIRFQTNSIGSILSILRDSRTMFATAFSATFLIPYYAVFTFFGPLIEASAGNNPEVRSGFLVIYGLGAVAGNYLGGYLNDRIGAYRTLFVLCIVEAGLLPLFAVIPLPLVAFALLVVVCPIFAFAFMVPQQSRLVRIAPHAASLILSLNAAMLYVGVSAGSASGSSILAWQGLAALGIAGGVGTLLALVHLVISERAISRAPTAARPFRD